MAVLLMAIACAVRSQFQLQKRHHACRCGASACVGRVGSATRSRIRLTKGSLSLRNGSETGRIAARHPRRVIVPLSDTNEYANLIGGKAFEPEEHNPILLAGCQPIRIARESEAASRLHLHRYLPEELVSSRCRSVA